jgi:hypothetical protein
MAAKSRKKPERRGTVGVRIYEQVEQLTAGESLGRTEALRRVAKKTGKSFGTVAANFYRVARKRGAKLRSRRPRAGSRGATGRGTAAGRSADLRRVLGALQRAAGLLRRQEAEITRLELENRRFAEIRKLVGRA